MYKIIITDVNGDVTTQLKYSEIEKALNKFRALLDECLTVFPNVLTVSLATEKATLYTFVNWKR